MNCNNYQAVTVKPQYEANPLRNDFRALPENIDRKLFYFDIAQREIGKQYNHY